MEVYKDNALMLKVNTNINKYDGHTVGAEYQSLIITTPNSERIIKLNLKKYFYRGHSIRTKKRNNPTVKKISLKREYLYLLSQ